LEEENKEKLEELKTSKEEVKEVKHELNEKMGRASELASELDTVRGKLTSKREKLSKLKAEQASIKQSIAGGKAIKAVLDKDWDGVHGTVSELGKVDSEFSLALEIAAGSRLKNIVVDDDEVAAKCIEFLKNKKLGYATFLPMNKLKSRFIKAEIRNLKGKGIHGLAIDLVDFDTQYEKVFKHVFGSTLVVDDIATARKVGIGKTRMVTKEGDLISGSGSMTGGHRSKKRKGLGFKDKEVTEEIDNLEDEIADLEGVAENVASEKKDVDERVEELKTQKSELEGTIIKLEKSLHFDSEDLDASKEKKEELESKIDDVEEEIDDVQSEISDKTKELTDLKVERQELREKLSELRNPAVLAEINSYEDERNELKSDVAELEGEKKGFVSELENVHRPEKQKIEEILEQHKEEYQEFEEERESLAEEIKEMETELQELEAKEKEFHSKFRGLFDRRQELSDEIKERENTIVEKQKDVRELEKKKNNLSVEKAEVKGSLEGILEELKEYDEVEPYTSKDQEQIENEVEEFEKMTEDLGNVNMKALDMYDQVKHEYENLLEKKDTLQEEREEVLVMINKIDSRKKELFMKTYDALNENFKRIFSNLSNKGDASLELEDEDDPFEGGVGIKVRLKGKKYLDIRSLSGGEKTMTALSFIFAVQEYEPAPFYIMDEVDAALDKRNSEKLANLIQSYAERAQYIIISHNDQVIAEADNLYGVSMNEHGETKVTSLEV
jgi:chromosome segregation protein